MTEASHRRLTCRQCGHAWLVSEVPVGRLQGEWRIDPERYVCPDCVKLKAAVTPEQPSLLDELEANRVDERAYDPDIAEVPY